jgi:hypothetical protein
MCTEHGTCSSWRFWLVHVDDDAAMHFEWYWMDDNVGVDLAMSVMVAAVHIVSDVFSAEMGLLGAT